MMKSKRVMRRQILSELFELLQEQSPVFISRETFLQWEPSLHDLDALLAFRYSPRIEELRYALDRLEAGTYGICLSCKSQIPQGVLDCDPTQRVCPSCEQKFVHVREPAYTDQRSLTA